MVQYIPSLMVHCISEDFLR